MFIKPFKTKSNVQLKSSDRKKLQHKISTKFTITDNDLSLLFPNKGTVSLVKIITHCEQIVTVYAVDKLPLFFEISANVLLPTVYALWQVPNMLPCFTTHPDVLPRLAKGANLMLPGLQFQKLFSYIYISYNYHFWQVLLDKDRVAELMDITKKMK